MILNNCITWLFFFLAILIEIEPMAVVDMTYTFDAETLQSPAVDKYQFIVKHNGTTPNGFWLQLDDIFSGVQAGTHMIAPCHFKKGGRTLDKIPIHRMIAPAAVINVIQQSQSDSDYLITVEDLQRWEMKYGDSLNGKIVLLKTGWGRRWPNREAFFGTSVDGEHFPGLSPEAAKWLVDYRRVMGVGIDTPALDNGPSKDKKAHQILMGADLFGLEIVANMEDIPENGATLYALPMKVGDGSGGAVRIAAVFPEYLTPQEPCNE